MGVGGKSAFSWPLWIGVAAITGFLAALLLIPMLPMVDKIPDGWTFERVGTRHAIVFFVSGILSLPALGLQILMKRCGIRSKAFYLATVVGGAALLGGFVEGILIFVSGYRGPDLGARIEYAIFSAATLFGCVLAVFFQTLSLPASIRLFYFLIAAPGAAIGLAVAGGILIAFIFWRHGDIWMMPVAFGIGWTLFAAAAGWPIRRSIGRMEQTAIKT